MVGQQGLPPDISIVAPVYNEEAALKEYHKRVTEALERYGRTYEIIFVDDGSDDSSRRIVRQIVAEDARVRALFLSRNSGQWAAVFAGLRNSRGEHVVVMDTDLQHAPEEIPALVEKAREGYDLVSGWRQARGESFLLRRFPSLVANWLMRLVTKCKVHDMGGFKCLRGEWARSLHMAPGSHRFLPALVFLQGGSIAEVPISAPLRRAGRSKYGISRMPNVALDILSLWFQAAYLGRPLHLLGKVAAVLIAGGVAVFTWLLYDKFFRGLPMGSRPPMTMATLSILLGVQCLMLGFLADVISRIYQMVHDRLPYHVREELGPSGDIDGREEDSSGPTAT